MDGVTATAAIECAAGVSSPTGAVASVESVLPASIVGAISTAAGLSLLALVLLLAMLAALCLMSLIGLLWVLWHASRGLVAKCVAKHLDLPLHGIDGGVVVAEAFLRGGVCRAEIGYSISQVSG